MKLFTFYLFVAILTQLLIPFFLQSGTEALKLLSQGYSALSKSHPNNRPGGKVSELLEIPDLSYSHVHLQWIRLANAELLRSKIDFQDTTYC